MKEIMADKETSKFTGFWHGAYFINGMSPGIVITAEELGGEDVKEPKIPEVIGCNKKDHARRSIAHQPNHLRFWRKHRT